MKWKADGVVPKMQGKGVVPQAYSKPGPSIGIAHTTVKLDCQLPAFYRLFKTGGDHHNGLLSGPRAWLSPNDDRPFQCCFKVSSWFWQAHNLKPHSSSPDVHVDTTRKLMRLTSFPGCITELHPLSNFGSSPLFNVSLDSSVSSVDWDFNLLISNFCGIEQWHMISE